MPDPVPNPTIPVSPTPPATPIDSLDSLATQAKLNREQSAALAKALADAQAKIKSITDAVSGNDPHPVTPVAPVVPVAPTKPVVVSNRSAFLKEAAMIGMVVLIGGQGMYTAHRLTQLEYAITNPIPPIPDPTPSPLKPTPIPTPGGSINADIRAKSAAFFGGYLSRYSAAPAKVDAGSTWNDIETANQAAKKVQGTDLGTAIDAIIKPDVDASTAFSDKAKGKADLTTIRDSLKAGMIDAINAK